MQPFPALYITWTSPKAHASSRLLPPANATAAASAVVRSALREHGNTQHTYCRAHRKSYALTARRTAVPATYLAAHTHAALAARPWRATAPRPQSPSPGDIHPHPKFPPHTAYSCGHMLGSRLKPVRPGLELMSGSSTSTWSRRD